LVVKAGEANRRGAVQYLYRAGAKLFRYTGLRL
jgi:hypothetical protein